MTSETEETVLDLLPCPFCGGAAEVNQIGNEATKSRGFEVSCVAWGCATKKRAMVIRQPMEKALGFAIKAWNTRAALSRAPAVEDPEDWDRIPRAKRFGRRLDESAVKHLAPGTLLRFYSEDPWFDPAPSSPANGDIVVFTGAVSNTFPKVGPHLEVRTLGGRVYPGGGWVYQIFQFVADPSPEMGEISREELERTIAYSLAKETCDDYPTEDDWIVAKAVSNAIKLKENGLSREELGGLARSQPGAAGPSDCAEGGQPLSDGGANPSGGSGA